MTCSTNSRTGGVGITTVEVQPNMEAVAMCAGVGGDIPGYDVFSPEVREREFDLGENDFDCRFLCVSRIQVIEGLG